MKPFLMFLMVAWSLSGSAQDQKAAPTLKSVLLAQLRSTHNKAEWFVPGNTAVEGFTAEQASWTDGKGNHSVGQLTAHLVFWNRRQLAKFKGEQPGGYSGNNDDTFKFDSAQWSALVRQFDQVMSDLENTLEAADDEKLKSWYADIAHIGTHNAYHIGQIIFVRKEQGSWNPEQGVK